MKQYHLLVSGLVQGVGYRHFVKSRAEELGLSGWVRNREDGQVEIMVIGRQEKINKFINLLRKGPILARVEAIKSEEVKPLDLSLFGRFEIIR